MRDDTAGALQFAERQIRRLLTGEVSLRELVMTGGLWRVTGQTVAAAAAAADAADGDFDDDDGGAVAARAAAAAAAAAAAQQQGGSGGGGDEVRGPHASLAVRLARRDAGREFVLGERLPYVLLAGARRQDDAAEDPLAACLGARAPDAGLYYRNKLQARGEGRVWGDGGTGKERRAREQGKVVFVSAAAADSAAVAVLTRLSSSSSFSLSNPNCVHYIQPPLNEVMRYVLSPQQLRHLAEGPHTRARAAGAAAGGGDAAALPAGAAGGGYGLGGGGAPMAPAGLASPPRKRLATGAGAATAVAVAAAPAGDSGNGGGGSARTVGSPPLASPSGGKRKQTQAGMQAFFQVQEKCLGCRKPMASAGGGGGGLFGSPHRGGSGSSGDGGRGPPGLCAECRRQPGAWAAAELSALADASRADAAACRAEAACRACHSGGALLGPVLCLNGECPVLYARFESARAGAAAARRLERLDAAAREGCAPIDW